MDVMGQASYTNQMVYKAGATIGGRRKYFKTVASATFDLGKPAQRAGCKHQFLLTPTFTGQFNGRIC